MKTTFQKTLLRLIIGCCLFCGLHFDLDAQDTNVDWDSASDAQVIFQAIELTTPVPSNDVPDFATYYSAQHSPFSAEPWPPLPANVESLDAWDLGSNIWVLDDLGFDYDASSGPANRPMMAMDEGGVFPPGAGSTNTFYPAGSSPIELDPGTNLWIAQETISNGYFTGILSNAIPGVEYQLLSMDSLDSTQWVYQGDPLIATTNYVPWVLPYSPTNNFFLNALSLQDDGSGLPIWWQLKYFGTTGIDPDSSDPSGDGWSNWQKYAMGINPSTWITPPAPQGLTVDSFNSASNTATLSWMPSLGPVEGYILQTPNGNISLGGDVTSYVDNSSSLSAGYAIQSEYVGGPSPWSDMVWVDYNAAPALNGFILPGPRGNLYLAISGLPSDVTAIQIDRYAADIDYATLALFPKNSDYMIPQICPNDPLADGSFEISANDVTNGIVELPSSAVTPFYPYQFEIFAVHSNGVPSYVGTSGSTYTLGRQALAKVPYIDQRRQLKDNLQFLLRAADDRGPFLFAASDGFFLSWPTNHVCVDFYDDANGVRVYPDPMEPVEDNFIYKNFVFDPNNLTSLNGSYGLLNTGISYNPAFSTGGYLALNFANSFPPPFEYYFDTETLLGQTNPAVPSSVLVLLC